jgi:hypothetical protein
MAVLLPLAVTEGKFADQPQPVVRTVVPFLVGCMGGGSGWVSPSQWCAWRSSLRGCGMSERESDQPHPVVRKVPLLPCRVRG